MIRLLFEAEDHPPLTGARSVRPRAAITDEGEAASGGTRMRSPTLYGFDGVRPLDGSRISANEAGWFLFEYSPESIAFGDAIGLLCSLTAP